MRGASSAEEDPDARGDSGDEGVVATLLRHPWNAPKETLVETMSLGDRTQERTYFDSKPIVAWRVWRIHKDGLASVTYSTVVWPMKQPLVAACRCWNANPRTPKNHESPPKEDACGIHAHKEPDDHLMQWTPRGGDVYGSEGHVLPYIVGQVSLWGRVMRHEHGYRAQYAYPLNLSRGLSNALADDVEELAELYGVPVRPEARYLEEAA